MLPLPVSSCSRWLQFFFVKTQNMQNGWASYSVFARQSTQQYAVLMVVPMPLRLWYLADFVSFVVLYFSFVWGQTASS